MVGNETIKITDRKRHCDFLLRGDIIEKMEIVRGPGSSESEQRIIDALAEKYGIEKMKIRKSSLRIKTKK